MLPRSAFYELLYSFIPGSLIVFGMIYVRFDLAQQYLSYTAVSEFSRVGFVILAALVTGFLAMGFIGGPLLVAFAFLGCGMWEIPRRLIRRSDDKVEGAVSYGQDIIWRRLATKFLGDGITTVQSFESTMQELSAKVSVNRTGIAGGSDS